MLKQPKEIIPEKETHIINENLNLNIDIIINPIDFLKNTLSTEKRLPASC